MPFLSDVQSLEFWWAIKMFTAKTGSGGFPAYGSGNATAATPINRIKKLPQTILVRQLLRRYAAPEALVMLGRRIAEQTGCLFDFDHAKQILSLDHILRQLPRNAPNVVCVIGDGYGYLTSLIHRALPQTKVICVNLGRTLFFDIYYTRLATETSMGLITAHREGGLSSMP